MREAQAVEQLLAELQDFQAALTRLVYHPAFKTVRAYTVRASVRCVRVGLWVSQYVGVQEIVAITDPPTHPSTQPNPHDRVFRSWTSSSRRRSRTASRPSRTGSSACGCVTSRFFFLAEDD